jgi:hypothetical protein
MRCFPTPVLVVAVATALAGHRSFGVEPATAPTPTATETASADDVPALIKQLGADDPKTRDAATRQLRRLGQIAAPALTEAEKSDDPEVAGRAELILRQIRQDGQPVRPGAGGRVRSPLPVPRLAPVGRRAPAAAEVREVDTVDGGKRVKIREDGDGVSVTTVEKTPGGAEVTRTTKARDAAALKREFPEVYPLYEKHAAGLRAGVVAVAPGDVEINPLDADGNIDVDRMLEQARRIVEEHRPMIEAQRRLADEQLREARRQLDEQVRQLREEQK